MPKQMKRGRKKERTDEWAGGQSEALAVAVAEAAVVVEVVSNNINNYHF